MKRKNPTEALNDTILALEKRQFIQLGLMKEQFQAIYEELRPANVAHDPIDEDDSIPEKGRKIVNNAIGATVGYVARRMIMGTPTGTVKKMIGRLMQSAIANVVSTKHADTITSTGGTLLSRILKYRKKLKKL